MPGALSPAQTHIRALQRPVATVTPEERERALARAAEVGAVQAGRELGIAPGTIRVWRSRAAARADNGGRVDMPGDVSGVDPADTWTAAQEALAQFRELIAFIEVVLTLESVSAADWHNGVRWQGADVTLKRNSRPDA